MQSALMNLLDEELKCPICLDIVNDPVILPCKHHFCKTCINTALTMDRPLCRCPVCKRCYMRRPSMMQSLNLTSLASQYLALMPRQFKQCGLCRVQPGDFVVKVCLTCNQPCCSTHIEEHLSKPSSFPGHLMVNIEELDNWTCSDHELYKLLYCKDEELTLCRSCSRSTCSSHTVCSVNEKSTEMKEILFVLERSLDDFDAAMAEELKEIKRDLKNMMDTLWDLGKHVSNHYRRMKNYTLQLLADIEAAYKLQYAQHIHDMRIRRVTLRDLQHSTGMCLRQVDTLKFLKKGEFHKELINRAKLELGRQICPFRKKPPNLGEILSTLSEHERRKQKFLAEIFQLNEPVTSDRSICPHRASSSIRTSSKRRRTHDDTDPSCSTSADAHSCRRKRLRLACRSHGSTSHDPHSSPPPTHSRHDVQEAPSSSSSTQTRNMFETQERTYSEHHMDSSLTHTSQQASPPLTGSVIIDPSHGGTSEEPHSSSNPPYRDFGTNEYLTSPSSTFTEEAQTWSSSDPFRVDNLTRSTSLDSQSYGNRQRTVLLRRRSGTSQESQTIPAPPNTYHETDESPSSSSHGMTAGRFEAQTTYEENSPGASVVQDPTPQAISGPMMIEGGADGMFQDPDDTIASAAAMGIFELEEYPGNSPPAFIGSIPEEQAWTYPRLFLENNPRRSPSQAPTSLDIRALMSGDQSRGGTVQDPRVSTTSSSALDIFEADGYPSPSPSPLLGGFSDVQIWTLNEHFLENNQGDSALHSPPPLTTSTYMVTDPQSRTDPSQNAHMSPAAMLSMFDMDDYPSNSAAVRSPSQE